jgi:hypothetical protein
MLTPLTDSELTYWDLVASLSDDAVVVRAHLDDLEVAVVCEPTDMELKPLAILVDDNLFARLTAPPRGFRS